MQCPIIPANEAARLETLYRLNILDTPHEERFDRYTRLAQRVFEVPIVLISLVDRNRQWFKSQQGLLETETNRKVSFCGHAILNDEVFEIRNARRDARFRDNPLVTGMPHIRFYAGAPLKAPDGHNLGTLCLIDRVPSWLTEKDKRMLADMADMVVNEIVAFLDFETGLTNPVGMQTLGERALEIYRQDGLDAEILLFDIGKLVARLQGQNALPPIETVKVFTTLLRERFGQADVIARIGDFRFLVMRRTGDDGKPLAAAHAFCEALAKRLEFADQPASRSVFVDSVKFDSTRHHSISDLLFEVNAQFYARATAH